jgi:hypothetical protein
MFWTERQDDLVKKYYPVGGNKAVLRILPMKSASKIRDRARKLGVKSNNTNVLKGRVFINETDRV